jgi:hypothetical protein
MTVEEMRDVGSAIVRILRGNDIQGDGPETAALVARVCERLAPYSDPFDALLLSRGVGNG